MKQHEIKKHFRFFKDTVRPMTTNSLKVFLDSLTKKEKIRVVLRCGLELEVQSQQLYFLQHWKEAVGYGINIEVRNGNAVLLDAFPVAHFSFDSGKLNDIEIINLVELFYDCVRYGFRILDKRELQLDKDLASAVVIDLEKNIVTAPDGSLFHLRSIVPGIFTETFLRNIHDRFLGDLSDATVLDIGANFGDSSVHFGKMGAHVWAVEPIDGNFKALLDNLALNKDVDVHPIKIAAGPRGKLKMVTKGDMLDGAASGFYDTGGKADEIVESKPISDIIQAVGGRVDFLKMDCKGCEKYLTVDELKMIDRFLHLEFDLNASPEEISRILSFVKEAGFEFFVLNHNEDAGLGKGRNYGTIYAERIRKHQ